MPTKGRQRIEAMKLRDTIHSKDPEMGLLYTEACHELGKRKHELITALKEQAKFTAIDGDRERLELPKNLGSVTLLVEKDCIYVQLVHVSQIGLDGSALRHLGIGRLMMSLVEERALSKGLHRIELKPTKDAIRFYEILGFKKLEKSKDIYYKDI